MRYESLHDKAIRLGQHGFDRRAITSLTPTTGSSIKRRYISFCTLKESLFIVRTKALSGLGFWPSLTKAVILETKHSGDPTVRPRDDAGGRETVLQTPALMRFVPVVGRAGVDLEGDGEFQRRVASIFHDLSDQRDRGLNLGLRHLEDQLVMHLKKHLRVEL